MLIIANPKLMKTKITLLVITALSLCLYACQKEDQTASIVGKWQLRQVDIKQENLRSMTPMASMKDTVYGGSLLTADNFLQFNADKTGTQQANVYYNVDSLVNIKDYSGHVTTNTAHFTYSLSASTVTLTSTDYFPGEARVSLAPRVFTIVKLDAHNLVLMLDYNDTLYDIKTTTTYTR